MHKNRILIILLLIALSISCSRHRPSDPLSRGNDQGVVLSEDEKEVLAEPAFDYTLKLKRENLEEPGDFILVNYQREVLGQRRVGHISPIGAYDAETDRVLILDTASYNYPPTWVPLTQLYSAMAAIDPASGRARGFVEVAASR